MSRASGERPRPRVAIVGGGLAGLAAAVALADADAAVEIIEARRQLGGRAASFRDPQTDELVDYCQHVSLGCCEQLADFCRRTGISDQFRRDRVLHFFTADGTRYDLRATPLLPAPLHLAPALWRLRYLSPRERWSIARVMLRLACSPSISEEPLGAWLRRQGQSPRAIEQFWSVVLVSALGETIERAALRYARKVFVDAFLTTRHGYEVLVPRLPLSELFGVRVAEWLEQRKVTIHRGRAVGRVAIEGQRATRLVLEDGSQRPVDAVIVAVPWRRVGGLLDDAMLDGPLANLAAAGRIEGSPITGVHLWFDRPIMALPHAVLVGLESQWLFQGSADSATDGRNEPAHYYQVVVSASRELSSQPREEIVARVIRELQGVWPAAREAKLLKSRVVTDPWAVFSPSPGIERLRPAQQTAIANLAVAGDWTDTGGWPATMEGAVRSGYRAAEAIRHGMTTP